MDVRFILVAAVSAAIVSMTSLAWPKFTSKPRPQAIQAVRDFVIRTPAGQQLSSVLGVTDESNVQPVSISVVAGNLAGTAVSALTQKAQNVVITQATNEIAKQYDALSPDQKRVLETIICKSTP